MRYGEDAQVLADLGRHLSPQIDRIMVRLPRAVAEAAVAAWNRDEPGAVGEESRDQAALREAAAELALIGLALTERGEWHVDEVVVALDVVEVAAALRAAR